MLKSVVVIVIVGAACSGPAVVPTVHRCADGQVASIDGADTSSTFESTAGTKRTADARFFKELKYQVSQHWRPSAVWEQLGAKTAVHNARTWITKVAVSLARNGHVLAICVVSPSGIKELDEEAVRASWAAAPFRDPPDSLFEDREYVTFPFTFQFQVGKPPILRAPVL